MIKRSLLSVGLLAFAACHASPDADACDEREEQCEGTAQFEITLCHQVSIAATPVRTFVGRRIAVQARTPDVAAEGLRARWSSEPDGRFGASSPDTEYLCETEGSKQLHVEVTDARGCASRSDVVVDCVAPSE
jgi:hypothetical protein